MERVYSYNPKPAVGATVAERCFGTQSHKVTQLSLHSVVCRLAGCLTAQKCFKYVVYVKAWPTYIKRNLGQETGQTEPGLVALYDIRPGNGMGLFLQLQPRSPHGACTHKVDGTIFLWLKVRLTEIIF